MTLYEWAERHAVSPAAIRELAQFMGAIPGLDEPQAVPGLSEAAVQANLLLEARTKGIKLFRNNVGAGTIKESGSFLRWGLANESAAVNATIKSGDLIGIRPVIVTPAMVGHTLGVFVSREAKADGWRYTGTEREQAQRRWANLILSLGGDAAFASGPGTL